MVLVPRLQHTRVDHRSLWEVCDLSFTSSRPSLKLDVRLPTPSTSKPRVVLTSSLSLHPVAVLSFS